MLLLHRHARRGVLRGRVSLRLLLAAATAFGSDAVRPADQAPLSLPEAVDLAEYQAPQLHARVAGVTAAEAATGPAGQLPDPEFLIGLQDLPVTGDDAFSATRDAMTMRTVGVMQSFPRREKRRLRSERAAIDLERERALLVTERLTVREAAARAWILAAAAERRLTLMSALQPIADAQLAAATAALTAGRGTAADAIAARAAIAALQDRIDAARTDRDTARLALARWLPDLGARALGEAPDWRDPGGDPATLLSNLPQHRALLAYAPAERAAAAEVALARADKRPDWSLELMLGRRGPQLPTMVSVQLRIPLALSAARRQDPIVAAKRALATRISAERESAQREQEAALRTSLAVWRSTLERTARYERELLPLSKDRADAALAAYRGGRGDLAAALRALDEAIELRLAYIDLHAALGQAWAALYFAFPKEPTP